jgi:assimilatory nitrate reductase catalytic subunit
MVSFPNHDVLKQALETVEFLVVQDAFHPTPTSELAHLVLPAAMWGEKEGTYTNSERRVSKVNRAVAPPAEARPDFDIFLDLAARLGVRDELFPGWQGPRDAFEEWKRVSAGRLCDYSAMTWEEIEARGGMQWGGERLYADGAFPTPDGRAQLFAIHWEPFPDQPGSHYPFILNTGRTVEHWHTGTKTRAVPILAGMSPRAWLEMNPRDAQRLHLKPHDHVSVISKRSRLDQVELRVTEIVAPGQVFMPFHFVETNSNRVTQSAFDPISREPNFKQCAVNVEKARGQTERFPVFPKES